MRLVSRERRSGTRKVFERRLLGAGDERAPGNSADCTEIRPEEAPDVVHCERGDTGQVLDAVRRMPGALGCAAGRVEGDDRVLPVRIDGVPATRKTVVDGAHPCWENEFACTYEEPRPGSLVSSFLEFLRSPAGGAILRHEGDVPCADLDRPSRCAPER